MQEHLYGLMEDFTITVEDKNLNKQVIRRVPRFTLIGATTHSGLLNAPLISRFQYKANLLPYSTEDLTSMIITAGERIYDISIPYDIANRLAKLSRRTARIAYNLLRSLVDIAEAQTPGKVTPDILTMSLMNKMLKYEQIDPIVGLDSVSRKYLVRLIREGGPLGSKTLANYVQEQEITVTGMIEPFLFSDIELQFGDAGNIRVQNSPFVRITSKGRLALEPAYNYIKLCHQLQKQGWFTNESLNVKPE
jgi:Holliday junction DNA helicase RuvB